MGVKEFSADSWQASSPGLFQGLANRMEALNSLAQGLVDLAGSDNISGQGADAMRNYILEVHVPLVQSLLLSVHTFQTAVGVYWDGYQAIDSDGNFRLVNDEFDDHLSQLDGGKTQLAGYGATLERISADAAHLVSLGRAGAGAVEQTVGDLASMRLTVQLQQEAWEAYEASDPGFNQVKELISEVNSILANVGNLTVGQGRTYQAGSFNLTLGQLGELAKGMSKYCEDNAEIAADGWEALFDGYTHDVEEAKKDQALVDLIWDGLQVAGGILLVAAGAALAPFSGGLSLGVSVLGGSMVVGGINSAINHVSIATTGEELNLVGMASESVGKWYDANVAQPAAESGSWPLEFLAAAGSGVGQMVSGAASLNVKEFGQSVHTLITDSSARSALWEQLKTTAGKVAAGDAFVIGELVGPMLVPGGAALKITRAGRFARGGSGGTSARDVFNNAFKFTEAKVVNFADDVRYAFQDAKAWARAGLDKMVQQLNDAMPAPQVAFAGGAVARRGVPTRGDVNTYFRGADGPNGTRPTSDGGGTHGRSDEVRKPRFEHNPFVNGVSGALKPNIRYRASAPGTDRQYIYHTNAKGLIEKVEARRLFLKGDRERLRHESETPDKLPGDEAGHLIADVFDGSPDLQNLVSQSWKVNRGAGSKWAEMERTWRRALGGTPPKDVTDVEIRVLYDGSKRPTKFDVHFVINGDPFHIPIPNPILEVS